MKNLFLIIFLSTIVFSSSAQEDCGFSNSYVELDINNVRAGLNGNGYLWSGAASGKYIAPIPENEEPEVSTIRAGGLWLAAKDASGSIRLSAPSYYQFWPRAFAPGPLNAETGATFPEACLNWDKHFLILRSDIEAHIADFADNGTIDNPLPRVYEWPGQGNPDFSSYLDFYLPLQALAPFVDTNNNGIYEPAMGDYPKVKGDQAVWWVFNDLREMESDVLGLGVEVQMMAYAFASQDQVINNTTFYEMKYINRSSEILTDFQAALWVDNDLGCYTDDAFGFDVTRDLAYYYNIDAVDGDNITSYCFDIPTYGEEIPMLGIQLLEDSAETGVSSFMYFGNPSEGGVNNAQIDPQGNVQDYLNYMNAKWRDGSPLTEGGSGYGGDTPTSFAFASDSSDSGWSFCSEGINVNFDSRTVMSTEGITFAPGAVRTQKYTVLFTEDVEHPCPDITAIQYAADVVENFCASLTSQETPVLNDDFQPKLYPNPNAGNFYLDLNPGIQVNSVEIYELGGKLIEQQNLSSEEATVKVKTELPAGVYFVKIETAKGETSVRKMIVNP